MNSLAFDDPTSPLRFSTFNWSRDSNSISLNFNYTAVPNRRRSAELWSCSARGSIAADNAGLIKAEQKRRKAFAITWVEKSILERFHQPAFDIRLLPSPRRRMGPGEPTSPEGLGC